MLVPGAMAAIWAARAMNVPADAACAPEGETYTTGSVQPDHQALRAVFRCAFDAAVNEVGSGRVDGGVKGDDLDGLCVCNEGNGENGDAQRDAGTHDSPGSERVKNPESVPLFACE